MMNPRTLLPVLVFTLSVAASACGGGAAVGLKHTVSEKKLVGLSPESTARIEQHKGEVLRAKDVFDAGDFEIKSAQKDVSAAGSQTEHAADAVGAAADTIEATDDKRASEIEQAKARRDDQIAAARKRYTDETDAIRARYDKLQAANRATLATAKRSQEMAAAQKAVEQAELAEVKARGAVRKQEINVAKAKLELVKLEELHKTTGVVGPAETVQKLAFEQQLAGEEKKLADLQVKLDAKVKATETARAKVEQVKARSEGAPKSE